MRKVFRVLTRVLAVAAVICFIAGVVMANNKTKAADHDVANIHASIVAMRSDCDQSSTGYGYNEYRVTFDITIENDTKAEIGAIAMTFSFQDASGKTIGTMRTTFGSGYSSDFRLGAGQSITLETYLSERAYEADDLSGLLGSLYGSDLTDHTIGCTIADVTYTDGYQV